MAQHKDLVWSQYCAHFHIKKPFRSKQTNFWSTFYQCISQLYSFMAISNRKATVSVLWIDSKNSKKSKFRTVCTSSNPVFSQNAMLPAGMRQRDQTKKSPTGPFDRDALVQYLEKEALECEDREDLVPFTGEKKGGWRGDLFIWTLFRSFKAIRFIQTCFQTS